MRFRRRGGGRQFRAPREPVFWLRQALANVGNIDIRKNTVKSFTLFDPSTQFTGAADQHFTIMRIKILMHFSVAFTGGANGNTNRVRAGICVDTAGTLRNPNLPTVADQETDWLWLGEQSIGEGAAAETHQLAFNYSERYTGGANAAEIQGGLVDIKAKRRMQPDELLMLNITSTGRTTDLADDTTYQLSGAPLVSVLYQRSMRRR